MEKLELKSSELDFSSERIAHIFEEFMPLIELHWEDSRIFDDLKPDVNYDLYLEAERLGRSCCFTARADGELVGYQIFIVEPHHHYQQSVCANQLVLFLLPEFRKGLAGYRFLRFCEKCLAGMGVDFITQHTKKQRDLTRLFERQGYTTTDTIMIKRL